jgi:hypothetical protein
MLSLFHVQGFQAKLRPLLVHCGTGLFQSRAEILPLRSLDQDLRNSFTTRHPTRPRGC